MNMADLITSVLEQYGIVATLGILGWVAFFRERRRGESREDKLLELAISQVQATANNDAAIEANTKVLENLDRTIDRYIRG